MPNTKPSPLSPDDPPGQAHADWDELASDAAGIEGPQPVSLDEIEDAADEADISEDDDDNAYEESDEALPDDDEEREIARDPSRDHTAAD